jgi:hypothetical protein
MLIDRLLPAANDDDSHAPDPPDNPLDWKQLASAYHTHHFNCPTRIAVELGSRFVLHCSTVAEL